MQADPEIHVLGSPLRYSPLWVCSAVHVGTCRYMHRHSRNILAILPSKSTSEPSMLYTPVLPFFVLRTRTPDSVRIRPQRGKRGG